MPTCKLQHMVDAMAPPCVVVGVVHISYLVEIFVFGPRTDTGLFKERLRVCVHVGEKISITD